MQLTYEFLSQQYKGSVLCQLNPTLQVYVCSSLLLLFKNNLTSENTFLMLYAFFIYMEDI
jgi:hypothetical protein